MDNIKIETKLIGENCPCITSDVNKSLRFVHITAMVNSSLSDNETGADAVKFQTFKADHLILKNVEKAPYQIETTGSNVTQYEMLKKLEVTLDQNKEFQYCASKDIIFLTTPFDEVSLDELDELDLPAYKIASTDLITFLFYKG